MKIGILQTGHVPENLVAAHGEYPEMFKRLLDGHGFEFENFAVVDGVFPPDASSCDGWLITGSRHGAYEDHAWIPPLEELIRDSIARGIPVVGICFGHQIMAQAMGGKVEKFSGGWGLGHETYRTDSGNMGLLALHQDQVVEKPEGAEVIASTDFCPLAGLSYGNTAISYQPHPEFTPEYLADLIEERRGGVIPEETAARALPGIGNENDSARIADRIARFFKDAQARSKAA